MRAAPSSLPVQRTGRYTLVTMPAEIDAINSDDVRERLLELLNNGTGALIIDLTGTTFCDSSGLKALIRARTRALALGRRLHAVVAPRGSVDRIFKVTAMARLIPVHDDADSAIAAALRE